MGYTHYWYQSRDFTAGEWAKIVAEAKRICGKAARGDYYLGTEDFASSTKLEQDQNGFRVGFNEPYAWRTFSNPDVPAPMAGRPVKLAGADGTGEPVFSDDFIAFNGATPEDYESFWLHRLKHPEPPAPERNDGSPRSNCTKTEYRAYDPVVVSILFVAREIAPSALFVRSDGGQAAIKLMF